MEKTTIKRYTPRNFEKIYKFIWEDKRYYGRADRVTWQLFEMLKANPNGNIWAWADNIVIREIDDARTWTHELLDDLRIYSNAVRTEGNYLTDTEREILNNYADAFKACAEILNAACAETTNK